MYDLNKNNEFYHMKKIEKKIIKNIIRIITFIIIFIIFSVCISANSDLIFYNAESLKELYHEIVSLPDITFKPLFIYENNKPILYLFDIYNEGAENKCYDINKKEFIELDTFSVIPKKEYKFLVEHFSKDRVDDSSKYFIYVSDDKKSIHRYCKLTDEDIVLYNEKNDYKIASNNLLVNENGDIFFTYLYDGISEPPFTFYKEGCGVLFYGEKEATYIPYVRISENDNNSFPYINEPNENFIVLRSFPDNIQTWGFGTDDYEIISNVYKNHYLYYINTGKKVDIPMDCINYTVSENEKYFLGVNQRYEDKKYFYDVFVFDILKEKFIHHDRFSESTDISACFIGNDGKNAILYSRNYLSDTAQVIEGYYQIDIDAGSSENPETSDYNLMLIILIFLSCFYFVLYKKSTNSEE